MNNKINIDARGLACPEPVILTKNAIEKSNGLVVEVIVDNETAKKNVMRMAKYCNRQITEKKSGDDTILILQV